MLIHTGDVQPHCQLYPDLKKTTTEEIISSLGRFFVINLLLFFISFVLRCEYVIHKIFYREVVGMVSIIPEILIS